MPGHAVLAIGIDPEFADPDAVNGFAPDVVQTYIDAQLAQVRAEGYDVINCLIDPADTGSGAVAAALKSNRFDCIMIGAGLRIPARHLLLFERVINLVHAHAPNAAICFNTRPADSADA